MKFDSDKSEHISLLNTLCNKAVQHFNTAGGHAYYSDCLRDVEALDWLVNGDERYWLVGDTCTVMLRNRSEALDMFHDYPNMKAVYTIKCEVSPYGTKRFSIELTN